MRFPLASATALIAFSALLGLTAIPAFAEDQPAQQNAQPNNSQPKPETSTAPAAQSGQDSGQANRKTSATNDQSGPSNASPTQDSGKQGDQAVHSVSGRGGKEEPGSHAPTQAQDTSPVLVNGKLNVAGAPADSQTVPAKFSEHNNAIDHLPIMGMSLGLTDEQKKAVLAGVKLANKPVQSTDAKVAHELAWNITVHDLGPSATDPMLAKLKYVRTQDRVLLIDAPNRIVVGEIKG